MTWTTALYGPWRGAQWMYASHEHYALCSQEPLQGSGRCPHTQETFRLLAQQHDAITQQELTFVDDFIPQYTEREALNQARAQSIFWAATFGLRNKVLQMEGGTTYTLFRYDQDGHGARNVLARDPLKPANTLCNWQCVSCHMWHNTSGTGTLEIHGKTRSGWPKTSGWNYSGLTSPHHLRGYG